MNSTTSHLQDTIRQNVETSVLNQQINSEGVIDDASDFYACMESNLTRLFKRSKGHISTEFLSKNMISNTLIYFNKIRKHISIIESDLFDFIRRFGFPMRIKLDFVFNMFYGLYNLLRYDSKFDLAFTLTYIANNILGQKVEQYNTVIASWMDDYVMKLRSYGKIKSESIPKIFEDMKISTSFDMIMSSGLIESTRTLILQLVGLRFFDRDLSRKFISTLGTPPQTSLIDFVRHSIGWIEDMIDYAVKVRSGTDFIEALKKTDPIMSFLDDSFIYTVQVNKLYIGDEENFPELKANGYSEAREFVRNVEEILRSVKDIKSNNLPFKARKLQLELIRGTVTKMINSRNRQAPLSFIFFGSPEIGKSSFLEFNFKLVSHYQGWKYNPSLVYHRNVFQDFWSAYESIANPIIHYSELGSKKKKLAETQGDEAVNELLSICDSQPFSCNMNQNDDKGFVFALPKYVMVDTNCPELNVESLVNNPAAVKRRFIYVELKVKPEYRNEDGPGLDVSKIPPNLEDKFDLWTAQVYKLIPQNNIDSVPFYFTSPQGSRNFTMREYSDLVMTLCAEHDTKRAKYTAAISEDVSKYISRSNIQSESDSETSVFYLAGLLAIMMLPLPTILVSTLIFLLKIFYDFNKQQCNFSDYLLIKICSIISYYFVAYKASAFICDFKEHGNIYAKYSYYFVKTLFVSDDTYFEYKIKATNTSLSRKLSYSLLAFTILLAFIKLIFSILSFFHSIQSESDVIQSSGKFTEQNIDSTLEEVEKKSGCSFPEPKKKSNSDKDYDPVENFFPRPVADQVTFNKPEEVYNSIMKNLRYVILNKQGVEAPSRALGLCKDYMLINRHVVKGGGLLLVSASLKVSSLISFEIDTEALIDISDDIVLMRVPGALFKDITLYFADLNSLPYTVKGIFNNKKITSYKSDEIFEVRNRVNGNYNISCPYVYTYPEHENGLCGTPLVITCENKSFIVALHTGGSENATCYGSTINKKNIVAALNFIEKNNNPLNINSEGCIRLPKGKTLQSVTPRSPILYEQCPSLMVIGSISNYSMIKPTSKLVESPILEDINDLIGLSPYGDNGKLKYLPPQMKSKMENGQYIAPYNVWIRKVGVVKKQLDTKVMLAVTSSLSAYLIAKLNKAGVKELKPYTLSVAQNGYPENFYIRAMKNSTSGGFLLPGKKKNYNNPIELPFKKDAVMPNYIVKEQVMEILDSYESNTMSHNIVGAQLKDEPRAYDKAISGKTRVFAMSSYEMTLVNRMYLMPFYSLMCEHRDIFSTKVGINMHSPEAQDLYLNLINFSDNIMEGDYGGYDTSMPVSVGSMANTVVYNVLREMGYNEYSLKIVQGILSDNLYPTIAMEGNLFVAPGFQPSGKYATAEDNSLRGLILLYYAYAIICTKHGEGNIYNQTTKFEIEDFHKYLLPVTYGDDMLCSVKDEIKDYFNNITYGLVVEQVYGMEFTTADKHKHNSLFVIKERMSFLKRSFFFNTMLNRYVAIIDKDSIVKSLSYNLPSTEVTIETQTIETMCSMLRELFFYCVSIEEYEIIRKKFANVASLRTTYELKDILKYFPTGVDLFEQYK
jgi:hypothetical protein